MTINELSEIEQRAKNCGEDVPNLCAYVRELRACLKILCDQAKMPEVGTEQSAIIRVLPEMIEHCKALLGASDDP